VCFSELGKIQ